MDYDVWPIDCMGCSTDTKAREARLERGGETDYELYELISENPGLSAYGLSKLKGWSIGRTHSSILWLEKKGLIKVEHAVEGGRVRLVATPKPWQEFFTKEELEEMSKPEFMDEVDTILEKHWKEADHPH